MSKKCPQILTQHEVNKRILAKEKVKGCDTELLNPSGRCKDEDYNIYKIKRQQFYDSVKEYKTLNKLALHSNRYKSDIDGDAEMKFNFLDKLPQEENIDDSYRPGLLLRKRSERPIQRRLENTVKTTETMKPWFRKYIVLNRFIFVVRKLLLKNRMLRRLKVLKELNAAKVEEYERQGFRVVNVSYAELFAPFIGA